MLEPPPTRAALVRLIARFRRQERRMVAALAAAQAALTEAQTAAVWALDESPMVRATLQCRCDALQRSSDDHAVDLSHLRLALAGAREELARHAEVPAATLATAS
ncbi:MAG: hypothetical protein FJ306_08620 [Planctomycetes bacterium]|nr:hypothetical protein [Planctomycetota bacterium]